jgi:hypothetical protein
MQILVRLEQRQRLKADVNQELNSRIRLRLFEKIKAKVKEMTPNGGRRRANLAGYKGVGDRALNRIDLWLYNAHSHLSSSLAMHKTGQWCFLIHLNDISAILRSILNKHWRSLLREELRLLRCGK